MNTIREINKINARELELGVKGSWHDEFKDTAYVYVGGLHPDLTEGDVITIMSQWGEIADINMPRDKETGATRGFGFVMYMDQRSTVLAVDNMSGAEVLGRKLKVDHARYKQPGKKNEEGDYEKPQEAEYNALPPLVDESSDESEAEDEKKDPADEMDEEDPMTAFLREEKRKADRAEAKARYKAEKEKRRAERAALRAKKEERMERKLKEWEMEDRRKGGGRSESPRRDRGRDSKSRDRERSPRRDRERDSKSRDRERSPRRDRERESRDKLRERSRDREVKKEHSRDDRKSRDRSRERSYDRRDKDRHDDRERRDKSRDDRRR